MTGLDPPLLGLPFAIRNKVSRRWVTNPCRVKLREASAFSQGITFPRHEGWQCRGSVRSSWVDHTGIRRKGTGCRIADDLLRIPPHAGRDLTQRRLELGDRLSCEMLVKCSPATRESRSQCHDILQLGQPGLYFREVGSSSYYLRCALGCAAIHHHTSYFFFFRLESSSHLPSPGCL